MKNLSTDRETRARAHTHTIANRPRKRPTQQRTPARVSGWSRVRVLKATRVPTPTAARLLDTKLNDTKRVLKATRVPTPTAARLLEAKLDTDP